MKKKFLNVLECFPKHHKISNLFILLFVMMKKVTMLLCKKMINYDI